MEITSLAFQVFVPWVAANLPDMEFMIRSFSYRITRDDVLSATRHVLPGPAGRRHNHFVTVHGREYPVKQVLRLVIGQPRTGFHTRHALGVLSRLQFPIAQRINPLN